MPLLFLLPSCASTDASTTPQGFLDAVASIAGHDALEDQNLVSHALYTTSRSEINDQSVSATTSLDIFRSYLFEGISAF
jgi:hypothetical protein